MPLNYNGLARRKHGVFAFNASTRFITFFSLRCLEEMGDAVAPCKWHGLGAHLALPQTWWCTPQKKKSSRCLALGPALQPSPSVLQKALQQPTEHPRHGEGESYDSKLYDSLRRCMDASWSPVLGLKQEEKATLCFFQVWRGKRSLDAVLTADEGSEAFCCPCDTVFQSAACFSLPNTESNSGAEYGSEFQISC